MGLKRDTRRKTGTLVGSALLAVCLPMALSACGSDVSQAEHQTDQLPYISLHFESSSLSKALVAQAAALSAAAEKAALENVCTTDPADRQNCRNPSGTIDPAGGDLDGDGVFEDHEPVGPGYKDPRAYDGGRTSGETQCEWLRSQGIAC
ncbi:hypothetical protein NLX86_16200 [Streptomyces sp. A3M-1-3]|uniref:hypothetical protein n=1 Tax=Streptomyces sp. A3M-1-3 TaxID=2962044 RepID=UPI0020B7D59E|nr:hypothetical protein [Streptomyces sp. A3M-1-3]MCP3819587.1 hypothetical protein [Streptomyces sp. A3M-1-3]